METKDIRALVAKSASKDWFNNLSVSIQYKQIGFKQDFTGVTA